jgi:hypothetical protein
MCQSRTDCIARYQLVWASKQQQVLVDFGTSCAAFKLEIVGDNRSASLAGDSSLETLSSSLFGSGRKRVMPSLVKTSSVRYFWVSVVILVIVPDGCLLAGLWRLCSRSSAG